MTECCNRGEDMSAKTDHIGEAKRRTMAARHAGPDGGRIERAMYLTEANNHLLWELLDRLVGEKTT